MSARRHGRRSPAPTAGRQGQVTEARPRSRAWLVAGLLIAALVYAWAFSGMELSWRRFTEGAGDIFIILRRMLFPPEWAYLPNVVSGLTKTLQIAILGTSIAGVLAFPLGFLAARNVTGRAIGSGVGKTVLNAVRTFPELLLAIVLIRGVGPGEFAGVLTMSIHSVGMLGKLYADAIEAIDPGPREALAATGANRLQTLWFAVLPQVLPELASYVLYRFEINVRAAAVLGMVGAGGIGTPLLFNIIQRNWPRVGLILLGIIVVVSVIDWGSGRLRKRLV